MNASDRVHSIADKVAENKILTAVARVAITAAVVIGVPVGSWIVVSIVAHGLALADVNGKISRQGDRIARLETDDARDRERAASDLRRLNEIDRVLGQVEERSRGLLREIDSLRRRTSLDGNEIIR